MTRQRFDRTKQMRLGARHVDLAEQMAEADSSSVSQVVRHLIDVEAERRGLKPRQQGEAQEEGSRQDAAKRQEGADGPE